MDLFREQQPHEPASAGVFAADPRNPTPAPPGSKAVEIRNARGIVIACTWVTAEYADESFYERAWNFLDACEAKAATPLRLLP